jgi:DNA-binding NarL/FixJ family response regulator
MGHGSKRIFPDRSVIRVAIIEDDADVRNALHVYLKAQSDLSCLGAYETVEDFLDHLIEPPHVVLSDIELPGMNGIEGVEHIKKKFPDAEVMMLTVYHDSEKIFDSLRAGANGYVLKSAPLKEIHDDIVMLSRGGSPMSPQIARKVTEYFSRSAPKDVTEGLTDREREVVDALVCGLSYKLIADRLHISMETARFHIKNVYRKLQVNSKAEVISKVLRKS